MLMAAFFRDRLAGLFLNDVGPELDSAGLLRIRSYLGVQGEFASWEMAIANLKSNNSGFESLADDEWQAFAQRVFKPVDGLPRIDYDPALAQHFQVLKISTRDALQTSGNFFGKTRRPARFRRARRTFGSFERRHCRGDETAERRT